ncbi:oligosaccharide repeat unit polymerase [Vibrio alginolyticus]|uniref:O-antigen polymerase n=1 Tax=Vibrio alginolyticus TaxID=663 RepID=UPI001EB7DABF|nr:hypothetical protein [Vibrio alginolyticus]EGR0719387.1 oligosaccharide repeat unit polymerase [Vibrio alginolyticus]
MIALMPVILNLAIIYFDLKIKSVFVSFSIATFIVFSLPNFFSVIFGGDYSEYTYQYVTAHGTVFLAVFLITRLVLFHAFGLGYRRGCISSSEENIRLQFFISFSFSLIFLFSSLSVFDFSLNKLMSLSWSDYRDSGSFISLLGSFFLYAGSSFFLLSLKKKSTYGLVCVFILLIYIVLVLKTRNYLIAIVSPFIIYFLLYTRWNFKKLISSFLIFFTFFSLYSGARNIRHLGSISEINSFEEINISFDSGEFELINTLYYFVEKNGVELEYNNVTLIRLLLLPFPSSILPFNKPKELSYILWDQKMGITGVSGSLHPTVVGDSILNSFYFGSLIYGVLYSILFFLLDKFVYISKYNFLWFGLFCTTSFYIARGAVYNGIVIIAVGSLLILIFGFLASRIKVR